MENCSLTWALDSDDVGTPSMRICPDHGSWNLISRLTRVVFPAPVGPTMAMVEPGSTVKSRPWMTSTSGRYPKRTPLNSTLPFALENPGSLGSSSISGRARNSNTRSDAEATDCILAMTSASSAMGWLNFLM